jgi:hypothetical protein
MNLWQRLNAFDRYLRKIMFTWNGISVIVSIWFALAIMFHFLEENAKAGW